MRLAAVAFTTGGAITSPVDDKTWDFSLRTFKIADRTLLAEKVASGTHQEDKWSLLDEEDIGTVRYTSRQST